ncbi:hypothetical protein [Arthrobacter sp. CG_A4]|uniref:hypothetical protein n=1 Tax=Arthrobacter sp. CG_A4 TaxID=3071706 RepID=UPI002E063BAB|nr:hypothetical protein [Arthrobacter sp. CG_A4]
MKASQSLVLPNPLDAAKRTSIALLVGFLLAVGALSASPQQASANQPEGYYSVPYSGTLYYSQHNYYIAASYNLWQSDGFPAPYRAPTEYVRYSYSASIYAVSYFPGGTLTTQLGYADWQRAGSPSATIAGHVDGTEYHSWGTSAEIFATAPDGVIHKMNYSEWVASGYMPATNRANEGFQKLSWSGSVAKMYETAAGSGYPVSYAEWKKQDFPTPQTVTRFPNDEFCKYGWSSNIYYYGPSDAGAVSYAQWRAAGFPTPTKC